MLWISSLRSVMIMEQALASSYWSMVENRAIRTGSPVYGAYGRLGSPCSELGLLNSKSAISSMFLSIDAGESAASSVHRGLTGGIVHMTHPAGQCPVLQKIVRRMGPALPPSAAPVWMEVKVVVRGARATSCLSFARRHLRGLCRDRRGGAPLRSFGPAYIDVFSAVLILAAASPSQDGEGVGEPSLALLLPAVVAV